MQKVVRKIHGKCMAWPCQCLLPETGYTDIYIRKDVVKTAKALKIVPKKQKLPNGISIPNGKEMWIKNGSISSISGNGTFSVQNWKLNEVIRTINIDRIKLGT
jgi:hypothetical protein